MTLLLYLLFLLSGAAALIYEVVWFRSLGLVFGGSHLAVTTVLAVFMGGLALGSWLLGSRVRNVRRPLRLYGFIEIGIALSALVFALMLRFYPAIYGPLARLGETNTTWLSTVRIVFAVVGMIVPTTLMGGTLPVLSQLIAARPRRLGRHLALLYGFNTLGAVAGTLAAGFLLLPTLGVSRTAWIAVAVNLLVGLLALAIPEGAFAESGREASRLEKAAVASACAPLLPSRIVLWGIAISGFCALGYEVLWTRVLSMIVGTSVYSFAIMLVAFLFGIALGSEAQALVPRFLRGWEERWRPAIVGFGLVQLTIGIAALITTYALRDLPTHASHLQQLLLADSDEFSARQGASFVLAFTFMAIPAFFMGVAFPIAGTVHSRRLGDVGRAIGQVLAFNTIGAILGAGVSGLVLVSLFGIESSLQLLSVLNLGLGLVVLVSASMPKARWAIGLTALAAGAAVVGLAAGPDWARMWDREFFAVYRNNQRTAFETAEKTRDALENTDVLYFHEGSNETISVIRPRRGAQAFVVNGRVEASTHKEDIQCQRTLGHLPMLIHPNPRKVFVLGLGTGMTLGATSIHPEVEQITLAEIERGVFPAARTFGEFNHHVLDDPKLRIVHNDGRSFLRTTREKFDVITADPIHPWSGGASYLYTTEYFRIAADHLEPGGVMVQWLPIYELTIEDLRSVVRTFSDNFKYTAIWLTYYDAEILASDTPLDFDETRLAKRFAHPAIAEDLAVVDMGSPREFLSYMLMGDRSVRAFAEGGVLNTDDNLWLEFSAPRSQGVARLPGDNVEAMSAFRESPLDYTESLSDSAAEAARAAFWRAAERAAPLRDRAHSLALWGRWGLPELDGLLLRLRTEAPGYAPGRFLQNRADLARRRTPRPISAMEFPVAGAVGQPEAIEITAVTMRTGEGRGSVLFVDNTVQEIYGERYLDAPESELDDLIETIASEMFDGLRDAYAVELAASRSRGETIPSRGAVAQGLKRVLSERLAAAGENHSR